MELKRKSTYWGGEKEVNPEFAVLGKETHIYLCCDNL